MLVLATVSSLFAVASAVSPPSYSGFTKAWSDDFAGSSGSLPSSNNWNVIVTSDVYNNELEVYTSSSRNVQLTGDGHLQLIPHTDSSALRGWTSGRIESKYTFTPTPGKITRLEAQLHLGGGGTNNQKGIWPAFWLNGDSYRHGVKWPASGEVDILENINGDGVAHGVVHCDRAPGGVCNEPIGIANTINIPNNDYHTWRVDFDRRNGDFRQQSITWYMDGRQFHQVTGNQISDSNAWATLAQKPLYVILNVAVGGDWAGAPNSQSVGGIAATLWVGYVAHYISN